MRLILTRPEKDARPLAEKLRALGHTCVVMPLLDIVPRASVVVPHRPYQAVCITSANGLAAADVLGALREVPLLCVGPQSLAAALAAGFAKASAHGGDVEGLVAHIVAHLRPEHGPLLYLSGAATSGDLKGRLQALGFDVDRVITYDAVGTATDDFAGAVTGADAVLLYSPRTARLWLEQVDKANARQHMMQISHLCLSPAVAQVLPARWPRRIAARPDESAMLAALETLEPLAEQE